MNTDHPSAFRRLADDDAMSMGRDDLYAMGGGGRSDPAIADESLDEEADLPSGLSIGTRLIGLALLALAAGWIGFVGIALAPSHSIHNAAELIGVVGNASAPLCLILLAWLLVLRSSRRERRNFMILADRIRAESQSLEGRFARVNAAIGGATTQLLDQAEIIERTGQAATDRLGALAGQLSSEAATIETRGASAFEHIEALITRLDAAASKLPTMEEQLTRLTDALASQGERLSDRTVTLDEQLRVAADLADQARKQIIDANRSLSAQLTDMRQATSGASEELTGLAEIAVARIGTVTDQAQRGMAEVTSASAEFDQAIAASLESARSRLDALHTDSLAGFAANSDGVEARLTGLEAMLSHQQAISADWLNSLETRMNSLAGSFALLETEGSERQRRIGEAIGLLASESERLGAGLVSGNQAAADLIQRAETLLLALDSNLRELDESLPAALSRIDARIVSSTERIGGASPAIEHMESMVDGVLSRLQEADHLIKGHAQQIAALLDISHAGVAGQTRTLEDLHHALQHTTRDLETLGTTVGPAMVDALVRVRETADQAALRAREAILKAVPDATASLDSAARETIERAVGERVSAQIAELNTVAEAAVRAAHRATDQLMRQMMTIADTSAEVERRIATAREAAAQDSGANLGKLSAQLVESLNSASIDIARTLGQDVSEPAWAAYLKGDRGIFTRRAVRLADAAETRSILSLYESDTNFAEQVNRYIHDFETMLRAVLAMADGSTLAVTLLSSDIGKLYVVLAQAIERLRKG